MGLDENKNHKKHNLSAGDSTVIPFQHVNNLPCQRACQVQKIHRLEDISSFIITFDDGSLHSITVRQHQNIFF